MHGVKGSRGWLKACTYALVVHDNKGVEGSHSAPIMASQEAAEHRKLIRNIDGLLPKR